MQRILSTRKVFSVAAGIVVSIYFSLALVAFFCATTHASHHGHQATHSSLCTWACQANNSVSLISLAIPLLAILISVVIFERGLPTSFSPTRVFHTPRGPPRI